MNDCLRLPDVGGKAGIIVFKRLRAGADRRQRLGWQRDTIPPEYVSQCVAERFRQGLSARPFVRSELQEYPNQLFALDNVACRFQRWQAPQHPIFTGTLAIIGWLSTAPATFFATASVISGSEMTPALLGSAQK